MKGDFNVSVILALIVAAIILFIFAPMLFTAARDVWNTILQALGVIGKPSDLEKAMTCSYYRCVEGCLSPRVTEEIVWKEAGESKSCQDFCNNLPCKDEDNNMAECYTDTKDLKVCDDQAKRYPVTFEVKTSDEGLLSKDHIAKITSDSCIIYPGVDWTGVNPSGWPFPQDSYVYVNKDNLTRIEEWSCMKIGSVYLTGIKTAYMKPGIVYIFTHKGWPWGSVPIGFPLLTELSKTPPTGECKAGGESCNSPSECCPNLDCISGMCKVVGGTH